MYYYDVLYLVDKILQQSSLNNYTIKHLLKCIYVMYYYCALMCLCSQFSEQGQGSS